MDVGDQRNHLNRSKFNQNDLLVMEDKSLVYKLRRSCDKIEQLMKQVQILKRENQFKNKIIINLQAKQRQFIINIQSYQNIIQDQSQQLRNVNTKLVMTQTKSIQQIQLQQEYCKLQYRYANCEEENTILRNQLKYQQQQINMLQKSILTINTQNKQKQLQIKNLQDQNNALQKQNGFLKHIEEQFNWTKAKNIEKDVQMELELAKYRQMLSKYSLQLNNCMKLQQKWFNDYSDLTDTVNHIEQLRQCFRIRKALK